MSPTVCLMTLIRLFKLSYRDTPSAAAEIMVMDG